LSVPEPEAAADFAERLLGFSLVHVDGAGRHYLAAHGLDRYSLVYVQGEPGIDHFSFLVRSQRALARAQDALDAAGFKESTVKQSDLWRHEPAVRFSHPAGVTLELTTGVNVETLMHWSVQTPAPTPAPITCEHAILRASDVTAANEFDRDVMGLAESSRIVPPDNIPVLTFFRAHTLYHCFGTARSERNGVHHVAFTLKNDNAVLAAVDSMRDSGEVEIVWGPVRHGAGSNVAVYFRDQAGNLIEFSAEEELILNDETYEPDVWPISVDRANDEWGSHPPDAMKG
jgi:catechol 2,3-dioxygenase-like lactoylglutathione lyase family enzyme